MDATRRIDTIKFSIVKQDDIRAESVVEIASNTNSTSKSRTLFDPRLGTVDNDICLTCNSSKNKCTGHFGHYELEIYCINSIMLKPLLNVLSNICIDCGNVLVGGKYIVKLDERGKFHPKTIDGFKSECCKDNSVWKIKCEHCEVVGDYNLESKLECDDCKRKLKIPKGIDDDDMLLILNKMASVRRCTTCDFELCFTKAKLYVDVAICRECNFVQPHRYEEERMEVMKCTYKTSKKMVEEQISLKHVYDILNIVDKKNYHLIGFHKDNNLSDLLIKTLPIPPPTLHPVNFNYNNGEDGMVMTINNIIKKNEVLKKEIEKSNRIRTALDIWLRDIYVENTPVRNEDIEILKIVFNEKNNTIKKYIEMGDKWAEPFIVEAKKHINFFDGWMNTIQFYIYTMLQNDNTDNNKKKKIPVATDHKKHKLVGIKESISGKTGLIREHIDGKRTDWGCRSPITGDPSLDIDQVNIPLVAARKLYIEETVNFANVDKLRCCVANGKKYPGANFIVRKSDDRKIILKMLPVDDLNIGNFPYSLESLSRDLKMGDVVARHMMDGDVVFLNRQPTLHKHGIMVHRAKINLNESCLSLKINPVICNPYNADFDGDEMTFHVPRTPFTVYESWALANVPRMFILPRSNKPSYGVIQDIVLGAYLLSRNETNMTRSQFIEILSHVNMDGGGNHHWNGKIEDKEFYTGNDLLSHVFPRNFYCKLESGGVKIVDGRFVSGVLRSGNLGTAYNSIFQYIWDKFGERELLNTFNRLNRIVNAWNMRIRGNSATYEDISIDNAFIGEVEKEIVAAFKNVKNNEKKIVDEMGEGIDSNKLIDVSSSMILNNVRNKVGVLCKKRVNNLNNNIFNMVDAGSKGSLVNITQIIGLLGQQSIMGSRIELHDWTKRSLPFFHKWEDTPESRGFVRESYMRGLNPVSYFFHCMAGREGLIDTAVKTAKIGYISRKITKLLQEAVSWYDGSIRLGIYHKRMFISPAYGYNNISSTRIWRKKITCRKVDEKEFNLKWIWENRYMKYPAVLWEVDELNCIRNNTNIKLDEVQVCFNLEALLMEVQESVDVDGGVVSSTKAAAEIMNLIYSIEIIPESLENPSSIIRNINFKLGYEIRAYILDVLSSKRCVKEYKLSPKQLKRLVCLIKEKIIESRIDPGEPIGLLSASSLGEPATQLNLNSFHQTGIQSRTNLATGIPMLKRIVELNKDYEKSNMIIYPTINTKEAAKYIAEQIRYVNLSKFVNCVNFIYDGEYPSNDGIANAIDSYKKRIEEIVGFEIDDGVQKTQCPWIVELEIRRKILYRRKMTLASLADIISSKLGKMYNVYWVDGDDAAVIHLQYKKSITYSVLYNKIMNKDLNINIMGVKNIDSAFVRFDEKEEQYVIDTNGSNLTEILIRDDVDETRTWSNSIADTFDVMGVHATRTLLFKLIKDIFPMYIDPRHFHLLVDIMLHKAIPLSANRFGVNRLNIGVLNKIIFETPMELLRNAAIGRISDDTRGVNASSFFNTIPAIGTGLCNVIPK